MKTISKDELIGNLEAAYEDELKAKDLRSQANEYSKEVKSRLKDYAGEIEVAYSELKEAYRRFKFLKEGNASPDEEDYYTLITNIDEYFEEGED
jgi:uncharacterized protein YktA (UPF0223 family)